MASKDGEICSGHNGNWKIEDFLTPKQHRIYLRKRRPGTWVRLSEVITKHIRPSTFTTSCFREAARFCQSTLKTCNSQNSSKKRGLEVLNYLCLVVKSCFIACEFVQKLLKLRATYYKLSLSPRTPTIH